MTESDIGTATKRLPEDADQIGAREEQSAQLQREFLKLLIQSAEITVDGDDLPEIVETIDPPAQTVQPATMAGSLPREKEPDGATATRRLQENADRIGAREKQIARLQSEFQKLQLQSAEISAGGEILPNIVEAIDPPPQTPQIGDSSGEFSAPVASHRRCDCPGRVRHQPPQAKRSAAVGASTGAGFRTDVAETGGEMSREPRPWYLRAPFFIGSMAAAAAALTTLFAYFSWRTNDEFTIAQGLLWICFLPLFFNNAWMLWHAVYYFFVKEGVVFPEQPLATFPKTAIIFFVRKESTGLFERLEYTYRNNYLPNADLWVVSGEAPERYIDYERDVLRRLRAIFGEQRVRWLHSEEPANKKREMMDVRLNEYADEYKYFFACDADTMVPKNTLLRLLRKAEHPDNHDVGCFQANTQVASACTYFADNNRKAVAMLMELYLKTKQVVFGEVLSFGHNHLCRCSVMKDLRIPEGVMSHDIWDTVYLRLRGYRTVFPPGRS